MGRNRLWGAGAPFFAAVLVGVLGAAPAPGAEPQEFSPTAEARQLVLAPRAVRPTVRPEVAPKVDRLVYAVVREGQDVGTHRVEFASDGNRLTVRVSTDIAVRFLSLTVYRFHHKAEEVWVDGRLVSLTSRTDDDGKPRVVELRADGDRLRGAYNGKPLDFPASILPATLWHPASMRQSLLLDTVKGRPLKISIADRGDETIALANDRVATRRFSISGQLVRDVWYGPDGFIVQARFRAKDGSHVTLLRR